MELETVYHSYSTSLDVGGDVSFVAHTAGPSDDQPEVDGFFYSSSQINNLTEILTNQSNFQKNGLPQYYSPLYKLIGCFFVSVIFVVGLFGNVMVVIVVWRTKSMHTTTNCYLVSLAFADVILLISAALPTIVEYFFIMQQSIFGAVGCSIMVFLQYLGVNMSSLSITAFTIERYIAICHPMRAHTMCTIARAKRIIFSLWLLGVAYCGPWLALVTTSQKVFDDGTSIEICQFKLNRDDYLAYYMLDLILLYVVPLILTCLLYGLIARVLSTSARLGTPGSRKDIVRRDTTKRENNGTAPCLGTGVICGGTGVICGGAGGGVATPARNSLNSSRVQVTKMLAVVVCVFAVLWLPYRAYVVYNSFASQKFHDLWFLLFCRLMVYINSAINPILYNAMSVKFRWAFRRLLFCGKRPALRDGLSQYTQVSHANSALECVELRATASHASKFCSGM